MIVTGAVGPGLTAVVVERLAVVDITTGHGDNAHRIFQSLNATGVNLTQADLLRNLIFMLLPTRASAVYDEIWQPMERLIGFDNLEGLARVDLQRRGIAVARRTRALLVLRQEREQEPLLRVRRSGQRGWQAGEFRFPWLRSFQSLLFCRVAGKRPRAGRLAFQASDCPIQAG